MRVAWFLLGGAASFAVIALLAGAPLKAADQSGFTKVAAEELDKRSRQPQKGLSETRVRVMLTYAFSLIPDEAPGPDGTLAPVDKSDFNAFVIPSDDARQVIRAATRSAYADVCGLPDLGEANVKALMTQESKKNWTPNQMLMIEALHLFSLSYFTGNAQIVEGPDQTASDGATTVSKGADADQGERVVQAPPAPKCPPEQKQRVENAIKAYVASVQAAN